MPAGGVTVTAPSQARDPLAWMDNEIVLIDQTQIGQSQGELSRVNWLSRRHLP